MTHTALCTWAVFAVLVWLPFQLSSDVQHPQWSLAASLLTALLLYSTLRLTWIAAKGRAHPMSITFWVFVYIWCALAPLLQTYSGIWPRVIVHDTPTEFTGCVILWVGVLAYELGRYASRFYGHPMNDGNIAHQSIQFSIRSVLILSLVSVVTTVLLALALGGPDVLMGSRGDLNAHLWWQGREKSQTLLMQSLLRGPPFIATMALIYVLVWQRHMLSLANRRWLALALVLVIPLNFIANFPPALQRFWFGTIVLTYCFSLLRWPRTRPAVYILLLCGGLIFGFPVLNEFRKAGSYDTFSLADFTDRVSRSLESPQQKIVRGDYDAYQMLLNATIYVDREGSMMGKNIFDSFFFWVPRRWWPDKHVGSGQFIARYHGYRFTYLAAPLWMEAYLGFSWFGVIVVFLLYGAASAFADRRFENHVRRSETLSPWVWIISLLAGYQIYLLRGELLSGIAYLSCPLLMLLLMIGWQLRKQHSPSNFPTPIDSIKVIQGRKVT
jgi:hypothetical protein